MKNKPLNPSAKLVSSLKQLVENCGFSWNQELESDLPRKWKLFDDLIFVREGSCFKMPIWHEIGLDKIWPIIASTLKISRIALYRGIKSDDFRSPDVSLVWPVETSAECWVTKRENGINYSFDATRSMFSVGNFSEKARLAALVNSDPVLPDGEVAVDMFTGIGYFSLSLLVKCPRNRIKVLHCCEWNPAALQALRRNLIENGVNDLERVFIHEGDCRLVAPVACCQRVFLGLIPSSELAWPAACRALSPLSGGVIHVHSLVDLSPKALAKLGPIDPNEAEANRCVIKIAALLAASHDPNLKWKVSCSFVSNVKFYGPLLRHVVIDLHCSCN